MTIGYSHKVTDGVRFLTQMGSEIDGLQESKRAASRSQGWKFLRTFSMESSKGYWRRFVLPKIDLEAGRAEYRGD